MPTGWYELTALAARYWFALLGVVIAWRALRWLTKDNRLRKQVLRELPDAGYVGTVVVLQGESDALDVGDSINIPAEGILGSAVGCDVCIPHPSISAKHLLFQMQSEGMRVRGVRDQAFIADGQMISPGEVALIDHGSTLEVGTVLLQLRLFVGVELLLAKDADGERFFNTASYAPVNPKKSRLRRKVARPAPTARKPQKTAAPSLPPDQPPPFGYDDNPIYGTAPRKARRPAAIKNPGKRTDGRDDGRPRGR